ncbi:MAG TPA: hypothetical protein VE091_05570 [Gemmatimonadales bacterium]|jgi:hypothetical protein|nr:hypothetical protein [Gemmatimonadales bacterium]
MTERRSVGSDGLVHAVRGMLEAAVAQALAATLPWNYAALLHARRRLGERGFGVITLRGESLPLTRALLAGLAAGPIWVPTAGFVAVEGATTTDEGEESPIEQLVLRMADPHPMPPGLAHALAASEAASQEPGAGRDEPPLLELPATLHAATVTRTLILLSEARPRGWPA